jgi:predicted peptidase
MIVISPQCRIGTQWNSTQLLALLDYLEQRFAVDPDRIYVSGQSMGGYGTWALVATAPERFAAAVPVCGGGRVDDAKRLVNLPIWAFHGAKDDVIPLRASQEMIDAIKAHGGNSQLTVYPDKGHGICDLTFSRDDLYQWLLAQHRVSK